MQERGGISVVMATFNGQAYLVEQLDSIIGQTMPPMEIVCVDDGSSDRTIEILRDYERRGDIEIHVSENERNLGSIKTFERGCTLARGDFIAFSDQDDWWFPHKLEKLFAKAGPNERVAFAYSNLELSDENLNTLKARQWEKEGDLFHGPNCLDALYHNRVQGCTMLARASFVKECIPFAESVYHHDRYLALMAPALDMEIAVDFEPLIKYRQHLGNLISGVGRARAGESKKKVRQRKKGRTMEKARKRFDQLRLFDFTRFRNNEVRTRLTHEKRMLEAALSRKLFRALYHYHHFYRRPNAWRYYGTRYARHDLQMIFKLYFNSPE